MVKITNSIVIQDPKSPITESYKTLRSNILFSSLDKKIQTIVVTSSGPGEGKSTTSANLAIVMAQAGNKTILIDCDLRKPTVHKAFGISNQVGLSNLLIGESKLPNVVQKTSEENLHVLTLGVRPPNPSELLGSEKMKNFVHSLKETYDYIILDTPPVIVVTDALILSQYADGCLLVVAAGEAHRDAVVKAKRLLENVNGNILGIVLNKLDIEKDKYYGYYNYYYADDQEGKKNNKNSKLKSIGKFLNLIS